MRSFSRIQRKILLPLGCLVVVLAALAAFLAARATVRQQEKVVRKQAPRLARFVEETQLSLGVGGPLLVDRIKSLCGSDVAFYDAADGRVACTLQTGQTEGLAQLPAGARRVVLDGVVYRTFGAPVGEDSSWLYLLVQETELKAAAVRAVRPALIVVGVGVLLTIALGAVMLRSVTGRLHDLAAKMEEVARTGKPEIGVLRHGNDEISRLASTLQRMLVGLQESRQKLVEDEKLAAVGRVAASIAREVRDPLASLKKSARTLEEAAPRGDVVPLIVEEVDRLELLVDALQYYSKPVPLRARPSHLNEIIDDALATAADRLQQANVEVRKEYVQDLQPVRLDASRLKQATINLVLNAIQAMPDGGTLTVRTLTGSEMVAVELEDTGCGIPEEAREAIFEPFFTTRAGAIGLGLAVTRRIVEEHGGRIDFDRTAAGTIFRVQLPV